MGGNSKIGQKDGTSGFHHGGTEKIASKSRFVHRNNMLGE